MSLRISYCVGFALLCLASCIKAPEYPIEPQIEFVSISNVNMQQSGVVASADSTEIVFSFTDGDGDLGNESGINVELIDTRTDFPENTYQIPKLDNLGAADGINGLITVKVFSSCCIYNNPNVPPCSNNSNEPTDTMTYKIIIMDRAGNKSNEIETPPIVLRCAN